MNWIALAALLLVLVNLVATGAVFRVPDLSASQRVLQIATIWLLPVIGAVLCLSFASTQANTAATPRDDTFTASDGGGPILGTDAHASECSGDAGSCDGGGDGGGGGD
ncbi:MAG: hypothetical protein ACN6RG_05445 [Stenotrophomonas sp.]